MELVFAAEREGVCAAVVIPWERRGDFRRLWSQLARRDDAPRSIAWKRVKRRRLAFFHALVDELASRRWLRVVVSTRGIGRLVEALSIDPHDVKLRVEDALLVHPAVKASARIVDRRRAPGIRLARLLALAFTDLVGNGGASPPQLHFAREVRARWGSPL